MEETQTAVSFLLRIDKKEALALIDALVLQRIAHGEFLKLRERNPELANTAKWFWQYQWRWTARSLLRSDRERSNKLDECIKEIDRIVEVRVRTNQRVAPRGFAGAEICSQHSKLSRPVSRLRKRRAKPLDPLPIVSQQ